MLTWASYLRVWAVSAAENGVRARGNLYGNLAERGSCAHTSRVPAYFRKIPVAIATSFVARLLIMGTGQLMQKCVSRRGGHGRGVGTPPHQGFRKIEHRTSKKSTLRRASTSADPCNRSTAVTLLLKERAAMARACVFEREWRPGLAATSSIFA